MAVPPSQPVDDALQLGQHGLIALDLGSSRAKRGISPFRGVRKSEIHGFAVMTTTTGERCAS